MKLQPEQFSWKISLDRGMSGDFLTIHSYIPHFTTKNYQARIRNLYFYTAAYYPEDGEQLQLLWPGQQ